MKLEQARYIVAVYRTGSITQAAKDLYLSQPNISNSLKNLEQELGFKILTRSQNGAQFTEKGLSLVRHCQSILDEIDHIEDLQNQSSRLEFVIISPSYPPSKNAFVRLCNELSELNKYHLVMHYAQQQHKPGRGSSDTPKGEVQSTGPLGISVRQLRLR